MSGLIPARDYVEHFDPELPHHRAWLLAVLEQLVAHDPKALEEGGTLWRLRPSGLAGWRYSRGGPWVLHAGPSRIWFERVSVAATIRIAWATGCWMTEAAINRHRGGSQTAPDVVLTNIPIPPPELQELRLRLREVLAKIGYCMAAGMGTDEQVLRHDLSVESPDEGTEARLAALAAALESIADEAEVSAVQAVCEHVLLPDPTVTS